MSGERQSYRDAVEAAYFSCAKLQGELAAALMGGPDGVVTRVAMMAAMETAAGLSAWLRQAAELMLEHAAPVEPTSEVTHDA